VSNGPFLVLADIDHDRASLELIAYGCRIDLVDSVLDLAQNLCSGGTH
jgi:hypothetical protein